MRITEHLLTLIELTDSNANHIISPYYHLLISCRSLVDRCGSLGNSRPHVYFHLILNVFVIDSVVSCFTMDHGILSLDITNNDFNVIGSFQ